MLSEDPLKALGSILALFVIPLPVFQYWRCTDDKSWLEHCPATLVWNTKLGYCDYVDHADTSHCHLEATDSAVKV